VLTALMCSSFTGADVAGGRAAHQGGVRSAGVLLAPITAG
jgi:hypothetical protein